MTTFRAQRGFTFIELLLVMAIIGILAAIASAGYQNLIQNAQAASEDGTIEALASAAVIYLGRHGTFPTDEGALGAQISPKVTDLGHLSGVPNVAHTVRYNPATGCVAATTAGAHPPTHTHPTTC